ncbi:hypothetical protein ACH42_13700 [Endozoicomonas sp. (ex Bugula neritina AB1)]|nr:hypothetical protein ACH42_13700 [Endozoicomonas sp. (ex Bugula neritina AB1)]
MLSDYFQHTADFSFKPRTGGCEQRLMERNQRLLRRFKADFSWRFSNIYPLDLEMWVGGK